MRMSNPTSQSDVYSRPGPYLREGVTGSTPRNAHLNNFQHFQHIPAVAVVNIVTVLSRSITLSFHLNIHSYSFIHNSFNRQVDITQLQTDREKAITLYS